MEKEVLIEIQALEYDRDNTSIAKEEAEEESKKEAKEEPEEEEEEKGEEKKHKEEGSPEEHTKEREESQRLSPEPTEREVDVALTALSTLIKSKGKIQR